MASNGPDGTHANLHEELKAAAAELNESLDTFTSSSSDVNRHKLVNAAEKVLISIIYFLTFLSAFYLLFPFFLPPSPSHIDSNHPPERILDILTSLSILSFSPPNFISHTLRSLAFLPSNPFSALHALMWNNATTPFFHFEDYFSTYGHKEPQKENHISATFAPGCLEKPFFAWLAGQPGYFGRFIKGMEMIERETRVSERYDFGWLVEKAEREEGERAVFVDFG